MYEADDVMAASMAWLQQPAADEVCHVNAAVVTGAWTDADDDDDDD